MGGDRGANPQNYLEPQINYTLLTTISELNKDKNYITSIKSSW